jgi:hypothetical protein
MTIIPSSTGFTFSPYHIETTVG